MSTYTVKTYGPDGVEVLTVGIVKPSSVPAEVLSIMERYDACELSLSTREGITIKIRKEEDR